MHFNRTELKAVNASAHKNDRIPQLWLDDKMYENIQE
jgi:hypothetical protein